MSGPRILISSGLLAGGVQKHLLYLLGALKAAGADVTLAAALSEWPAADEQRVRDLGARLIAPSPLGRRFRAWAKFEALLRWPLRLRRDYDTLLAVGSSRMHRQLMRFVRPGGSTILNEPVDVPLLNTPARQLMTEVDGCIAMSEIIAAKMRPLSGGRPVRALPYLITSEPTTPPAPRPVVGSRELRVTYLGRLVAHKRPDWLVENWPRILAHAPVAPARLDIYGPDGGDGTIDRLRRLIRTMAQERTVSLHGPYYSDELPGILSASDIVVLPSAWEGLPLVLTEAMIRGVPVVATSAGGTAELANPDVEIVGTDVDEFPTGLSRLAARLRAGQVDAARLWNFAERHYGYTTVAGGWVRALTRAREFFHDSVPVTVLP